MIRHTSPISGVDVAGALVATAGYDNRVLLWDMSSGLCTRRAWHDHLANQCRFDRTGTRLVTASSDYTARIWSVPDLRLLAVLADHDDDVEMASFSPDGAMVATASRDGRARIFDVQGVLQSVLVGHRAAVLSVEWSSDGSCVYTSSDDGSVRGWNPVDGTELTRHEIGDTETDTIAMTADDFLIAGNDNGDIIVGLGAPGQRIYRGHRSGVKRVAIAPSGAIVVSAGYDQVLRVWERQGLQIDLLDTIPIPAAVWARSMAFIDDTALVFATFGSTYATLDLPARRWDLDRVQPTHGLNALVETDSGLVTVGDSGDVHLDRTLVQELGSVCSFVKPWKHRVVAGGHIGTLFDALTGRTLYQGSSPLNCATESPDGGNHLIVGTYTGRGLVLADDGDTARCVRTVALGEQAVKGLAASCDRVFAVDAAGRSRVFSWPELEVVVDCANGHDAIANDVCVVPGIGFATVSRDMSLRIWGDCGPVRYRAPLRHSLKCIAVDLDGKVLAVGAYDGSVATFDIVAGRWLEVGRFTTSGISKVIGASGSRSFRATSYDGKVYTFDRQVRVHDVFDPKATS